MVADWDTFLQQQAAMDYFVALQEFVSNERSTHVVHPSAEDEYAAFRMTPLDEVRVVILGQDPYHGPGQAHGLAFSVRAGVRTPPSLRNILTELCDDTGVAMPSHGDLSSWAQRGVLLLNTVLTVRSGEAASHAGHGWETLTDAAISMVNELPHRVVFVLWGAHAGRKRHLITNTVHSVLQSPHPSPLSAHRGFLGSRPFTTVNTLLTDAGIPAIDWSLD